jgi:hypothetical protein
MSCGVKFGTGVVAVELATTPVAFKLPAAAPIANGTKVVQLVAVTKVSRMLLLLEPPPTRNAVAAWHATSPGPLSVKPVVVAAAPRVTSLSNVTVSEFGLVVEAAIMTGAPVAGAVEGVTVIEAVPFTVPTAAVTVSLLTAAGDPAV